MMEHMMQHISSLDSKMGFLLEMGDSWLKGKMVKVSSWQVEVETKAVDMDGEDKVLTEEAKELRLVWSSRHPAFDRYQFYS